MSINGVLSSPSQRRKVLFLWVAILIVGLVGIVWFAPLPTDAPARTALYNVFASLVASGIFALVTSVFGFYFLSDPNELAATSVLLPEDIGQALLDIARSATSYSISVRTGRHFRAEILPVLVKQARLKRQPIKVEVVLLDFRDNALCDKYATYRKTSSFDSKSWDIEYVQTEVLATIHKIIDVSRKNRRLVTIELYLSKRLSTFRIEGSADEMLVTREDPKDTASRYRRDHRDFPAFVNELKWIREEAYRVQPLDDGGLPATLQDMFGADSLAARLEEKVKKAAESESPYVR
ncbi:hypothetical protein A9R05_22230 [Burkholderia sp. KK1]|nr:hypothetical protein A9R05_22230 [Burkholderia sp. KK1]